MKNDTRKYFSANDLEKDLIPSLMNLNKYFATTRKFVMAKYKMNDGKKKL